MDYSAALAVIKSGGLVKRAHWKNVLYIFLVEGSDFEVNRAPLNKILPVGTKVRYASHIDGCYGVTEEDGNYYTQVGVWTASNGDILATDWEIVTPNA